MQSDTPTPSPQSQEPRDDDTIATDRWYKYVNWWFTDQGSHSLDRIVEQFRGNRGKDIDWAVLPGPVIHALVSDRLHLAFLESTAAGCETVEIADRAWSLLLELVRTSKNGYSPRFVGEAWDAAEAFVRRGQAKSTGVSAEGPVPAGWDRDH